MAIISGKIIRATINGVEVSPDTFGIQPYIPNVAAFDLESFPKRITVGPMPVEFAPDAWEILESIAIPIDDWDDEL